ncbi:hypothetical protein J2W27_003768 [Variovorax boronicumulans]|uniref:hypothetical protein n=1 Tax=Variovorax boronicumulans TaxID=436515 RepID=UPI002783DB7F|nr:hypothetical protein [Variovorax boronicumulans]MDP9911644.1 hypothetical protein [Variovorax boronicumulans]
MKQKTVGGCPKPLWMAATVLAASVGVTACGGGGGGGGGGMPMLPIAPVPAPAPAPSPAPAPAPAPAENRAAVPGSEPSPSLSAPQPGSTAAVGNDSEGIYAGVRGIAFVGTNGSLAGSFLGGTMWGSLKVTGLDWSFNPDTELYVPPNAYPVTGSGTFTPKKSVDGTYAYDNRRPSDVGPLAYTIENALAVSQASMTGMWSNTDSSPSLGVTVQVDGQGVFTGSTSGVQIGQCTLSGTVALAQPGSAKNMYSLTLKAVNAATASTNDCKLTPAATGSYAGPAIIGLVPAGVYDSNGYFRSLMFLIRSNTGATLLVNLRKQP